MNIHNEYDDDDDMMNILSNDYRILINLLSLSS